DPNSYTGPPEDPARTMLANSPRPMQVKPAPPGTGGRFLIIDLREETDGLLEFSVEAREGTILEIAHGEHLDDGRVRVRIGKRNFADRFICREGFQSFQMPFRRLGARYLEIHIFGKNEVLFHTMGLRSVT